MFENFYLQKLEMNLTKLKNQTRNDSTLPHKLMFQMLPIILTNTSALWIYVIEDLNAEKDAYCFRK